ncbi:MAG TPA: glycoside hydrolase family 27 protein [Bryobacteraceae bacterium]|jgi:alpha-galactosidase|nr:glycoside hydrolase family 27 protein [Bryobacteraceae bacterium]
MAVVLTWGAAAQTGLTGIWKIHSDMGDGTFQDVFLNLKQNGSDVTGSIVRDYSAREIKTGTFNKGKIHLEVNLWREVVETYDGMLKGDELVLTVARKKSANEPNSFSHQRIAKHDSGEGMNPPAPLPVPELYDVADNGLVRTPPMGWNSWNHFAGRVTDAVVRKTADQIVATGMKDAGYIYINIDDTWQGARDAQGNILTNKKFPDMKGLADYVHSKSLKIGLYSSPGPMTCGGYEGSFGHEVQDAKTYAGWGFDYLKYDWCSAGRIYKNSDLQPVYQKMGAALVDSGRPIVYSLCEYGDGDVWKWGPKVGGNLWRTTGDISDRWESMESIGFKQIEIAQYAEPGHWNDPDMLEVGNGGMSNEEYQTHMTLWALLSAPLLAGNDLEHMSKATLAILTNRDVIAIDQDRAVHHPKKTQLDGKVEVWTRELEDGATVVALFNREDTNKPVKVTWSQIGLSAPAAAKNLWTQQDVKLSGDSYTVTVPKHGVVLLRLAKMSS